MKKRYWTAEDGSLRNYSIELNNAIKSGEAIKKSTAGKYCYIYTL